MTSLTLLALDGNPLATLPEAAFSHLRSTLRGLSLGGRFLTCDCRVRWIAQWIQDADLQVTSRERNPQFCGSPPEFRDRTFYQLNAEGWFLEKPQANWTKFRFSINSHRKISGITLPTFQRFISFISFKQNWP